MYYASIIDFKLDIFNSENKLLIFIGEDTPKDEISNLFLQLDALGIEYMGGIFPGVIFKDKNYNSGFIIKNIDNFKFAKVFPLSLEAVELPIYNKEEICSLVIVDGLSPSIKNFLNILFANYTDTIKYFGGGAGSMKPTDLPSIFYNGEFYDDSALVVLIQSDAELYVDHGWKKIDGPFLVTSSTGNILNEINWKTALNFYNEIIYEKTGERLTHENFFSITKGFPLGIETEDENIIVRDLWAIVEDNNILCVSDIPNHSVIYLLTGDSKSLLESSKKVYINNCKKNSVIFDCVSRALFLEDRFEIELANISKKTNNQIIGVLSIGELATTIKGRLEFLNKTLVYCEFN